VPNTFFLSGLNPPPQIQWPVISGKTVSFTICGSKGCTYQIQSASNLNTSNPWPTSGSVTLTNLTQVWSDPVLLTNASRFYRLAQTNPNPLPQIQSPVISGQTVSFTICGSMGYTYQIQSASSLNTSNPWPTLGSVTLTNSTQIWSDPMLLTNASRFYRLMQTNP